MAPKDTPENEHNSTPTPERPDNESTWSGYNEQPRPEHDEVPRTDESSEGSDVPTDDLRPREPEAGEATDNPAERETIPPESSAGSERVDATPAEESVDRVEPVGPSAAPALPPAPSPFSATGASPQGPAPKKRFGGKKALLAIVAAVLVVLLAGGAATYALWWNNPQKVMGDAVTNSLAFRGGSAKGSLTVKPKEGADVKFDYTLKTDGKNMAMDATVLADMGAVNINTSGSFVMHDGTFYVKVNDIKQTFETFLGDDESMAMYDKLIAMVDGKWVAITEADIKKWGGDETDEAQQCFEKALNEFSNSEAQQKQVADAYRSNSFVVISDQLDDEEIDGRLSNHYVIDFDEAKANAFADAVQQTDVYKNVDKCTDGELSESDDAAEPWSKNDSKGQTTYELWVDKWNHSPTKVKVTALDTESDVETVFESVLNLRDVPAITAPKADTTVKDLEAEIERLQQAAMQEQEAYYRTMLEAQSMSSDDQLQGVQPRVLGAQSEQVWLGGMARLFPGL